ncbi:MAG: RluA family pseudouridine synthase [Chlamydiae bacterium]|nr:RluA family pseudouridine synthase [Chlamydiota bacterium]
MEKFVDRLFASADGAYTKTKIRSFIDLGYAFLNGKMHRVATTPCRRQDKVELRLAPLTEQKKSRIRFTVMYDDPYIEVIDKPVGVESDPKRFKGLVHRLDKETSGLLIRAKTEEAQRAFEELFKERKIRKGYLAIVEGHFKNRVTIDLPIGRVGRIEGFEHFGVLLTGRKAITHIKPMIETPLFTMVACTPTTGRTHQIRVHLKAVSHPIVGDLLYGEKTKKYERMYLHANMLEFHHPFLNKKITIFSKTPDEFDRFIGKN